MSASDGIVRGSGAVGVPSLWVTLFRRRLRERSFWTIQIAILSITAFHFAFEALRLFGDIPGVESGLHHLPVILYLAPVVYAGLRYGFEGSVLTGTWCVLLTAPSVLVWHSRGFMWTGELIYVVFVVGVGVAVAVPVERERRQRDRVAAASRRLALLNDVASALVSSPSLDRILPAVLARLREVLGLEAVGVITWEPDVPGTRTWTSALSGREDRLRAVLDEGVLREPASAGSPALPGGGVAVPLGGERASSGALVVVAGERPLGEDEELAGAVASQIGVALDNDRLHRQEKDRLRSYVHEVTRVQEEERKRLARELHDTAAQDLVLLCRGLDALEGGTGPPPSDRRVGELRLRAGETLENLRRLSRDLRPTVLDDLGLVPALEWLAADMKRRTGMEAAFLLTGVPRRLPSEIELALFRTTQEALRNAERHAEAKRVEVRAAFAERQIRIDVEDDGRGFTVPDPPELLVREGRLGLLGIHERAQLAGGSVAVRSRPGGGTCVSVVVGSPAAGGKPRGGPEPVT